MTQAVKLREKLVNKLSDLFQLNQPDLDFGFYRIMHAKAAQVQQFIDQDLLTIISDAFGQADDNQVATARGHTEEIVEGIKHGVRKVNIDTDLRLAATGAIRRYMAQNPAELDPRKYLAETTKAMRDIAIARYEAFGAAGQAGKIKPLSLEAMFQRYESGELYK